VSGPVLGIDVSGPGGGAALLREGRETRLAPLTPGVARGRDLLPRIRDLLQEERIALFALDGIACGVGPGSFTGIRIAIATAATLAYAARLPVSAVCSLDGIAAGTPPQPGRSWSPSMPGGAGSSAPATGAGRMAARNASAPAPT